jgi:Skp family chaperone for outer membrane proteins
MVAAAVVTAAVVSGVAVTAIGKPAAERFGPPSPIIAMVDIPKVLEGLKEREARDKELEAAKGELQKKGEELTKGLEAEKAKIEPMANTPAKVVAAKAFRQKSLQAEFDMNYGKSLLAEQQATGLRELFDKIVTASAELAKARGYHLVISNDETVPVRGNTEEVSRTISLKRFIYVDPSMNITDELVQYMNNQYAAGAAKP